jgi:hypothetical protein
MYGRFPSFRLATNKRYADSSVVERVDGTRSDPVLDSTGTR